MDGKFRTDRASYLGEEITSEATLKAPIFGLGFNRATPDFRKMISLGQSCVDGADPINFARLLTNEKFGKTHLLNIATVGDTVVPIATNISYGRSVGAIDIKKPQARFGGKTEMDTLIDNYVVEGLAKLKRFGSKENKLFDPDDPDDGKDKINSKQRFQGDKKMRLQKKIGDVNIAQRFAYTTDKGQHSLRPPNPGLSFDVYSYYLNMIAWFFYTDGKEIKDDSCLETYNCSFLPGKKGPVEQQ